MKKKIVMLLALAMSLSFIFTGCKGKDTNGTDDNRKNNYISHTAVKNIDEGTVWPEGQFMPTFATPAEELDTISIASFKNEEQVTASALQGIVNKKKPRILLLDSDCDEGPTTWPKTNIMGFELNNIKKADRYEMVKKYLNEVKGVVLYDTKKSAHYRNLAFTAAGIKDLLPMNQATYDDYKENGIDLEIVEDLTSLTFTSAIDIYNHLYDNYWNDCNKRLLISMTTDDKFHIRDIGTATKSAHVYLDCLKEDEKAVFEKFLKDMEPGNGGVMGWFTTERSGITTVTKYGLSTVPANLYASGTVYAGTDHTIQIPAVPDKPELENKMYIAVYISDGDNIQYNQRYMRKLWDQTKSSRGKMPINWTVSPALVDAGPALLNYYYTTATEMECFVSGPSGLGYSMPVNTLKEPGADTINFIENDELFTKFVKFTDTYLQRSGLRVVTIWDNLSTSQRNIYTADAPYLYGLTVHDWHGGSNAASSVENNKLVQQMFPCYAEKTEHLESYINGKMNSWNKQEPSFMACQVTVWGEIKPNDLISLKNKLEQKYPGEIEFVRADHYYALYNEANKLPFDLSMSSKVTVSATGNNDNVQYVLDGTPVSIWEASGAGEQTLTFDLGGKYDISRYVIRHAGENGRDASLNTKDYVVEISTDGENWIAADEYKGNTENVTDVDIEAKEASHLRIRITNPGEDNIARIADVEIYGSVK